MKYSILRTIVVLLLATGLAGCAGQIVNPQESDLTSLFMLNDLPGSD